jgi:Uma2 family endonuclease
MLFARTLSAGVHNMSTTDLSTTPVTHVAVGRLLTIADVQKLPTNLPSGDVDYELNNGRLVIVSPPGRKHSKAHTRIVGFLDQAELAGHGEAFTEVGIVLWRDPDRLVGADAAFIARDRCPPRETKEGYLETIPDLVVEIRSKDDTTAELKAKAADYLKAGVKTVWLIDPIKRNATVYDEQAEARTVNDDGVLENPRLFGDRRVQLADILKG